MRESVATAPRKAATVSGRNGAAARRPAVPTRDFLGFRLGRQEYAVEVHMVQEIRGCGSLAGIADAPDYVQGVIDMRGTMVPVVDLRPWFKLESVAVNMFTVAIVLNLDGRSLGFMVDSVSDVIRLAPKQIKPAPASAACPDPKYLIGIGTDDERKLLLLDMEKLVQGEGSELFEIEAY